MMCGRYTLSTRRLARLEADLADLIQHQWPDVEPRFNIAPSQNVPIIRLGPEGAELVQVRWGLVPYWAEDPKIAYGTINARAETVDTKPAFRSAFRRRRCLVPATGWYEWQPTPSGKLPWYMRVAGAEDFAFAGLWERWERGEDVIESCTIIVGDAVSSVRQIHDRMPAILLPHDYHGWLSQSLADAGELKAMLAKPPAVEAYRVSMRVNKPGNDDQVLIEPVAGR